VDAARTRRPSRETATDSKLESERAREREGEREVTGLHTHLHPRTSLPLAMISLSLPPVFSPRAGHITLRALADLLSLSLSLQRPPAPKPSFSLRRFVSRTRRRARTLRGKKVQARGSLQVYSAVQERGEGDSGRVPRHLFPLTGSRTGWELDTCRLLAGGYVFKLTAPA
jgi:hypothetical protein